MARLELADQMRYHLETLGPETTIMSTVALSWMRLFTELYGSPPLERELMDHKMIGQLGWDVASASDEELIG